MVVDTNYHVFQLFFLSILLINILFILWLKKNQSTPDTPTKADIYPKMRQGHDKKVRNNIFINYWNYLCHKIIMNVEYVHAAILGPLYTSISLHILIFVDWKGHWEGQWKGQWQRHSERQWGWRSSKYKRNRFSGSWTKLAYWEDW